MGICEFIRLYSSGQVVVYQGKIASLSDILMVIRHHAWELWEPAEAQGSRDILVPGIFLTRTGMSLLFAPLLSVVVLEGFDGEVLGLETADG